MAKEKQQESLGRTVTGVVTSTKMQKTIVVKVERMFKHPMLGKPVRRHKLFKVHDESGTAAVGDMVVAKECAPMSKTKHMVLEKVL